MQGGRDHPRGLPRRAGRAAAGGRRRAGSGWPSTRPREQERTGHQEPEGAAQQGLRLLHRGLQEATWPTCPEDYVRKQTLVNAERFITPELKEYENKILGAQDRARGPGVRAVRASCATRSSAQTERHPADRRGAWPQLDVLAALADRALALRLRAAGDDRRRRAAHRGRPPSGDRADAGRRALCAQRHPAGLRWRTS